MSEIQRDIAEEDEVRRLVTLPERDLVVPPFAAVAARARRSRAMTVLAFTAAAAVVVFGVVASSDTRRPGAGDASATARQQATIGATGSSAAVLSVISGEVLVRPASALPLRGARDGEAVSAGASVQAAAPNGRAVLTFRDGSTIELEPGTTISVTEVSVGERAEILVRVRQERGRSWAHVQPQLSPNSRFHVATPSGTAVVRGTSFEIDVAGSDGATVTTVNVFQGQVDMVAAGMVRMVTASQTTEVVEGSAPEPAKEIGRPPVCLRMQLTSTAMMTVTDPYDRSVGRSPRGTVSQIPQATVNVAVESTQVIDIRSPKAGAWEVGITPNGDGGGFQLIVDSTVAGITTSGGNVVLTGSIQRDQRLVTAMRVSEDGRVTFGALQQTSRTRANIADPGPMTAPLPQAKPFAPAGDRTPDGCTTDGR